MKLNIIVVDRLVIVDGKSLEMDVSKLVKAGIHSVHFNNGTGVIEYRDPFGPHKTITDVSDFQYLITEHNKIISESKIKPLTDKQIKTYEERQWRNEELHIADRELFAVQDGRGQGTVGEWRDYRNELRDYPEKKGFPNCERPKSPKEKS